jgi:hypothetical protein
MFAKVARVKNRTVSLALLAGLALAHLGWGEDGFKEWHDDVGREKIKKKISVEMGPTTSKGFADGHGVTPYFTSADQLPKRIGIVTFYVFDNSQTKTVHNVSSTRTWVTEDGGNIFANKFLAASFGTMKAAFEKQGVVLLPIGDLLDTDEKKQAYARGISLEVSKMGKILTALESGGTQTFAAATGYRLLDAAATSDYMRARALGGELAEKLGVDALLSVGLEIGTDGKIFTLNGVKWALNGRNPNPKQDKKYVAESFGNGYNAGQCYLKAQYFLEDPVQFMNAKKKTESYEGFDLLMEAFVEKTGEVLTTAVEKSSK